MENITTTVGYVFQDEIFPIVFHSMDKEFYWEMLGLYVFIIEILVLFI